MSEKECSGDDNMLLMRGAGGETHSDVVYRPIEPMKDRVRGGRKTRKSKKTEIQTLNSNQEIWV